MNKENERVSYEVRKLATVCMRTGVSSIATCEALIKNCFF